MICLIRSVMDWRFHTGDQEEGTEQHQQECFVRILEIFHNKHYNPLLRILFSLLRIIEYSLEEENGNVSSRPWVRHRDADSTKAGLVHSWAPSIPSAHKPPGGCSHTATEFLAANMEVWGDRGQKYTNLDFQHPYSNFKSHSYSSGVSSERHTLIL